jgi:hypothetical protein
MCHHNPKKPGKDRSACLGCIRAYDGARAYLNWHIEHWHKLAPADRNGPEPSRDGNLKWSQKVFAKLTEEGGALAFLRGDSPADHHKNIREMYKGDVVTGRQRFATAMKGAWQNKSYD